MILVDRSLLCVISLWPSLGDVILVRAHLLLTLSHGGSLNYYSRTLLESPLPDLHEADDFGSRTVLSSPTPTNDLQF